MKSGAVFTNGKVLIGRLEIADTHLDRMRGLLGRRSCGPDHALLIPNCGAVHTFLMKFGLDLFFLDSRGVVKSVQRGVRPFRIAVGGPGAASVIETESGWLPPEAVQPGEVLEIREEA